MHACTLHLCDLFQIDNPPLVNGSEVMRTVSESTLLLFYGLVQRRVSGRSVRCPLAAAHDARGFSLRAHMRDGKFWYTELRRSP